MIVQANMQALNSNRSLGITVLALSKSTEKLSSGYKVNRAADDAAGLAISEKMRRQIKGLTQASQNAQDGISFAQIADGALDEVHDMLRRSKALAIQSANGTNSDTDRQYIQSEINELMTEIDRVSTTTVFNEINVFSENGLAPGLASNAPTQSNAVTISWDFLDADGNKVDVADSQAIGDPTSYASSSMALFVKKAAEDAVSKIQAAYPNLIARASSSTIKIGLNLGNIDGPGNTLASAELSLSSNGTSSTCGYRLNVDTSDYGISSFDSMSNAQKADLAATIAHEMTHLVMDDTLTSGMLNGRSTSFPSWFVEGMAQSSSGDNGWVTINSASPDSSIKAYMAQLNTMPYGAGYLGTMYLGQAAYEKAHPGATISSANIKEGLDTILTSIANGKTLDQAIATNTNYSGLTNFQNSFKSGDATSLSFVKNLLTATGGGAGSLLASGLGISEADAFAPTVLNGTTSNYLLNTNNTAYGNAFGTGYTFPPIGSSTSGEALNLQVGSEAGQLLKMNRYNCSCAALLEGGTMDVSTIENAANTLHVIDVGSANVSAVRSYYGALQNRLEHTVKNLDNVVENTTCAESQIRDTDMAKEMVAFSNNQILRQAGFSMLSQSNQSNSSILSLLQ